MKAPHSIFCEESLGVVVLEVLAAGFGKAC